MVASVRATLAAAAATVLACGDSVEIDVQLIDPCNQQAVSSMELLTFEPRGTGLDGEGLTTTLEVSAGRSPPIDIPLVSDFQLVVRGFEGITAFEASRASGLGVSEVIDLTSGGERVSVRVPFALLDRFYRTTELLEPTTCTELAIGRFGHTATYLPSSGKVLIVGGKRVVDEGMGTSALDFPRAVELYDPLTGRFEVVTELRIGGARAFHTATLLADGRILIAGGESVVSGQQEEALRTAFTIDARNPNDVIVSDGLEMRSARTGHRAVRVTDGRVVLIGGRILTPGGAAADHAYLSSIEVFDPAQGLFVRPTDEAGDALALARARFGHSASLVSNGQAIFVAGGMDDAGPILDPEVVRMTSTGVFSVESVNGSIGVGAIHHAATTDPVSGNILLSGGYARVEDAEPSAGLPTNPRPDVEMWRVQSAGVSRVCAANLDQARGLHTVSVVGNRVVFVGGRGTNGESLAASEWATVDPNLTDDDCFATAPVTQLMTDARALHATVPIERTGEVLIVGGRQQNSGERFGRTTGSAEIFSPARAP